MFEHLLGDLRSVLFPGSAPLAIPTMDGALTPNTLLDTAQTIGEVLPDCDDLAVDATGNILVSSGCRIYALSISAPAIPHVMAEFEDTVSALHAGDERIYAGISGNGLAVVENGREIGRVRTADGLEINCVTAICEHSGGDLLIAEGSTRHPPSDWCHDLMDCKPSGRIIHVSADLSRATTVADRVAWPYGLATTADGREVWYTESWRHQVMALAAAALSARPRVVVANLPGYPARLARASDGSFWLAVLAVRTHIVEHVLREPAYRQKMVAQVDPALWIAPSLRTTGGYLEPLQMGAIKKLGIMKPWAPPRSYGLVVHLAATGTPTASLHSRVGGRYHGITAARPAGDRLLLTSKGASRLLAFPGPI